MPSINNFDSETQKIIVDESLNDQFDTALTATLGYRDIAERVAVQGRDGDTIKSTRPALFAPVTEATAPAALSDLDNGMTPQTEKFEQWSLTLQEYKAMAKTNVFYDRLTIAPKVLRDAYNLGVQANQSLDGLARNALFDVYQGGHARVTNAVTTSATITVDDVRGFEAGQTVIIDGSNTKVIQSVTEDGSNTSTVWRGKSGVIVLTTTTSVAVDKSVVALNAPHLIRADGAATTKLLGASAYMTADNILDAVAQLEDNGIPKLDGYYNCFISSKQARGLYHDADIKNFFTGANRSAEYRNGFISEALGVRFVRTQMNPVEVANANNGNAALHRAAIVGADALVEGNFTASGYAGLGDLSLAKDGVRITNGIAHYVREPIDALRHVATQSWLAVLGYGVPTDMHTTAAVLPTASPAKYKRAIIVESR